MLARSLKTGSHVLVGGQETDLGELPGGLCRSDEGGGALLKVGEDAQEQGVGDGQEGAVAHSGVVEEGGAVAGACVEFGEAFAVFAA